MQKTKTQIFKYVAADFVTATIGWLLFNIYRYETVGLYSFPSLQSFLSYHKVVEGQLLCPIFWLSLFFLSGYYNQPFQKSRFEEFRNTFLSIGLGTFILFFVVVIDDMKLTTVTYFHFIISLFGFEFSMVYGMRYIITRSATHKIHGGRLGFNTLIIGSGTHARALYHDIQNKKQQMGYLIVGCVTTGLEKKNNQKLPIVGTLENLNNIVEEYHIERFILAPDTRNPYLIFQIVRMLFPYKLPIRMQAGLQDILLGKVRMRSLYETPMLDISRGRMSDSLNNCKRVSDILVSLAALLLLSPLYLILALYVKFDSKGPIFYRQERIGKFGRPFKIIKFRTMYNNAEENGPALSNVNDPRVTPLGLFLRKYRLDELPQFWNVLKGDMSLVGPRPERAYYIEQIEKKAPYYCLVHQVRPGITSWGMVKFGYACNVEEMIERLHYDILYLENLSMAVDCKILIYTIRTVLTGKGI